MSRISAFRARLCVGLALCFAICSLLSPIAFAQQSSLTSTMVPTLVKFGGVLKHPDGTPVAGTAAVTFLLYAEEQGGSPLWLETHSIQPDNNGHYTVILGSATSQGLPPDLFLSGEARWLGAQVQGEAEQPRVVLVSVPYALKAGDAETVGGLPPSAFMLAAPSSSSSGSAPASATEPSTAPNLAGSPPAGTVTGSGTVNVLPLWTSTSAIGNSALFQLGSGGAAKVGINTTTPGATLDVKGPSNLEGVLTLPAQGTATASAGKGSQPQDFVASAFSSSTSAAVNQTFQWKAEPSGNNTATPSGTLNLLFGSGTAAPGETGLKLSSKGLFTFATGQTFPGIGTITGVTTASGSGLTGGGTSGSLSLSLLKTCATNQTLQWNGSAWACATASGSGTITGVTAGTDLTGGGTSGNVTLNVDTTKVPQLNTANTFNGTQTVSGLLSIAGGGNYQPFFEQSSSTFGTWLELSNTSAGGHTWNILSAGGGNAEGAGNLGITNLTGTSTIWLEGNVNTNTVNLTGNLSLPNTNGTGLGGVVFLGGARFIHDFGPANSYNAFFGYNAGNFTTQAEHLTAVGDFALASDTTGISNTATGYDSLASTTDGEANTAFGSDTLVFNIDGSANTAVGAGALYENNTGSNNTAIGFNAFWNTNGSNLTCVGYLCNTTMDGLTNATAIGAHAAVGRSNSLVLGGTGKYTVNVGIGTTNPSNVLTIARGAGHPVSDSWETYSSRRWKTNIHTLPDALAKLERLRGVSYDLKDTGRHEIGVIAEEVGKVLPEVVTYEDNGKDARGVDYSRLTALLIEAVKQQQTQIGSLIAESRAGQRETALQREQIRQLRGKDARLQSRLARLEGNVYRSKQVDSRAQKPRTILRLY